MLLAVAACGGSGAPVKGMGNAQSTTMPSVGACRDLTPAEVARPDNGSATVSCSSPHDAETIAVGPLPAQFADADYTDPALGTWAYTTCWTDLVEHLGTDESTAMRSVLSWVWFRPSEGAWRNGARWYRCDLIGGSPSATSFVDLPTKTKSLLQGTPPDQWMACAHGATVATATKVACTESHNWRAVTTIKLGEPGDAYPSDAQVKAKTKSYCADSVDAWLGYPSDFDYGYTWFDKPEWQAGNRRSVCWAMTEK